MEERKQLRRKVLQFQLERNLLEILIITSLITIDHIDDKIC